LQSNHCDLRSTAGGICCSAPPIILVSGSRTASARPALRAVGFIPLLAFFLSRFSFSVSLLVCVYRVCGKGANERTKRKQER
jgi:hypothetical protein